MEINNHLEQEWKNYKQKSLFKSPIILGSTVFAAAFIAYMKFTEPSATTETVAPLVKVDERMLKTIKKIEEKRVKEEEKKQRRTPNPTPEVQTPKKVVIKKNLTEKRVVEFFPGLTFETRLTYSKPSYKQLEKPKIIVEKVPEPEIIVIKQNSSLKDLMASYNQEKSHGKALIIAKKYFEKKQYKDAINWSLRANELNSDSDKSWVIFAKSNIAIGRVEVALKAIDAYLVNNRSDELEKIKEDIFK